jgi:hypothetical protein
MIDGLYAGKGFPLYTDGGMACKVIPASETCAFAEG